LDTENEYIYQVNNNQPRIEPTGFGANQGQYVWDTRQINAGLYYYTLKTGHASKTAKLVVKH
jgi:hypothetical protein